MGGIQEGQTATNPKTGQRVMFHNGQWVDAGLVQPTVGKGAGNGLNSGDIAAAKNKIAALMSLNNQVRRSAQQFDANFAGARGDRDPGFVGGVIGRAAEHLPAWMNGTNDSFDSTVAGIAPLARSAFRTPGQGSDSDKDVALFMGMLPDRHSTDQGNQQRYRQMSDMIRDTINGQRQVLGMGPMPVPKHTGQRALARSNVVDFNDLPE